jgi:hypothetical protein
MAKGGAPKPPDPMEVASAQTEQNFFNTLMNQSLATTDQTTPYGTLEYTREGFETIEGPDGTKYRVPKYSAATNLNPTAQGAVDASQGAALNMARAARDQSGRVGDTLGMPFEYNPGAHEAWAGSIYDDLNADSLSREREALITRMAEQGIGAGSEAYDRALESMYSGQQDARNKFMLDSYRTGLDTALTERNQPLNELSALTTGSQVRQPSFQNTPTSSMANVDTAGLIMDEYGYQLDNYRAQQAQTQSLLGGILGLGANLIMSDRRVKTDIEKVGQNGDLGVYRYRYIWDDEGTERHGYMADEVLKVKPEAVADVGGVLAVDYGQLPEVMQ